MTVPVLKRIMILKKEFLSESFVEKNVLSKTIFVCLFLYNCTLLYEKLHCAVAEMYKKYWYDVYW